MIFSKYDFQCDMDDVISEVHPNLFISGDKFKNPGDMVILDCRDVVEPNSRGYVEPKLLDAFATLINAYLTANKKVLVHCWAGMERSPLVVAWWMMKYCKYKRFADAYTVLQARRKIIVDCTHWVEFSEVNAIEEMNERYKHE